MTGVKLGDLTWKGLDNQTEDLRLLVDSLSMNRQGPNNATTTRRPLNDKQKTQPPNECDKKVRECFQHLAESRYEMHEQSGKDECSIYEIAGDRREVEMKSRAKGSRCRADVKWSIRCRKEYE